MIPIHVRNRRPSLCTSLILCIALSRWLVGAALGQDEFAAPLPAGVRAVWDIDQAYRETTATREQLCLNGLWRWQPAEPSKRWLTGLYLEQPEEWDDPYRFFRW